MQRGTMMAALFVFVAGVVIGCGPSAAPVVGDDPPKPITKGELAAEEAKLADLEKEIAAKEKELAELRAKADAIRSRIGGKGKASGLDDLQKLIDSIPKETQPRSAETADIERIKANQWLKDNAIGKEIKLSGEVAWVSVTGEKDQYEVRYFVLGKPLYTDADLTDAGLVGKVRSGGEDWNAVVHLKINRVYKPEKNFNSQSENQFLGEAAAKRLRDLKGKSARIAGVIQSAKFVNQGRFDEKTRSYPRTPELQITLETVIVDGIDPRTEK